MTGQRRSRPDWERAERDFIHSDMSLRLLAKSRGLAYSTVQRHAREGGWAEKRERLRLEDGEIRLEQVTDKLLRKMAEAIDREDNMDCKDYNALSSALKELKDIQEKLSGSRSRQEQLVIELAEELEELSG